MLARPAFLLAVALSSLAACSSPQDRALPSPDAGPPDAGPPAPDASDDSPAGDSGRPDTSSIDANVDAGPPGPVQMNDVSILFPLPKTDAEFSAMLAPSSPGSGGVLLPRALYESATGIVPSDPDSGPVLDDLLVYPNLRLVALRLDPCFAQIGPITDPSSCQNQLRLIFQPVQLVGTPPAYQSYDGAVHAFYTLTRTELLDVVAAIGELRARAHGPDDLGPLAVHPVLAAQGLTGDMARGLADVVSRYAGQDRLVRFTLFEVGDIAWTFRGFDVAAGAAQALVIPTLPGAATSLDIDPSSNDEIPELSIKVLPATTSTDDLGPLLDAMSARAAPAAQAQAAYDSALRIENPNFHSPNTIDCASCHLAGPARTFVGEGILGLSAAGNPNAYSVASASVPPADTATTTVQLGLSLNLHAFSYLLGYPLINQRVINETAAVVAYLRAGH